MMNEQGRLPFSPTGATVTDLLLNAILVTLTIVMVSLSPDEVSPLPLRTWLCVDAGLRIFHIACAVLYWLSGSSSNLYTALNSLNTSSPASLVEENSTAMTMDVIYRCLSSLWLFCGFVGLCVGLFVHGRVVIAHDAPKLFWLSFTYVGLDLFCLVFCGSVLCLGGIAACCCPQIFGGGNSVGAAALV